VRIFQLWFINKWYFHKHQAFYNKALIYNIGLTNAAFSGHFLIRIMYCVFI
jgi:hypothetical protein